MSVSETTKAEADRVCTLAQRSQVEDMNVTYIILSSLHFGSYDAVSNWLYKVMPHVCSVKVLLSVYILCIQATAHGCSVQQVCEANDTGHSCGRMQLLPSMYQPKSACKVLP